MNEQFRVTLKDGTKISYRVRSTVVGTGETTFARNPSGQLDYTTLGTGMDDNTKEALGEIAEGAARGLVPLP